MTKIGFTRVNLQIYETKSDFFWEEEGIFWRISGEGRILTDNSIKIWQIWNGQLFFQRYTAFMAVFWAILWQKNTLLSSHFLVNICSKGYFFNFLYTALMIFLQKTENMLIFWLSLCGPHDSFFWQFFKNKNTFLSCPFWSKFVKNQIFQTFLLLLSLFL